MDARCESLRRYSLRKQGQGADSVEVEDGSGEEEADALTPKLSAHEAR